MSLENACGEPGISTPLPVNQKRFLAKAEDQIARSHYLRALFDVFIPQGTPAARMGQVFVKRSLTIFTLVMALSVVIGSVSPSHRIGWAFREGALMTWVSVLLLWTVSYICHKIWYLRAHGEPFSWSKGSAVWRVFGYGFMFLGFDELLRIHETLDRTLHKILVVKETPVTDHLDDVIIGLYGLVGIYFVVRYWREVSALLGSWKYFILASIASFLHLVMDFVSGSKHSLMEVIGDMERVQQWIAVLDLVEEFFKIYAEIFFVGAFLSVLVSFSQGRSRAPAESETAT